MTRNSVLIGLLIALAGCQGTNSPGGKSANSIKAQRTPTVQERQRYEAQTLRRDAMMQFFDTTLDGRQGKMCRNMLVNQRTGTTLNVQPVVTAAESGNATCQHVLGILYETGTSVPKDTAKAQALYLQAGPGDPHAYAELGRMARDGVGGAADPVKAREYYKRAGAAGAVGLGGLMEQGLGGPKDIPGALALYINATQKHNDPAWQAMRPLMKQGTELTAAQVHRYNQLWIEGLVALQGQKLKHMSILKGGINHSGQILTVKVGYKFEPGRSRPLVSLSESCGDPAIDDMVVAALEDLPMTDPYLQPQGQDTPSFVAPLVLYPAGVQAPPAKGI